LSMMLVNPSERRSGLGTRLLESALESLAGESCVRLDATPLGEPLYRRFGFSGESELVRSQVTVVPGGRAGPSPAVRPMLARDFADVLALARRIFGADRGALLASFANRAPQLARTLGQGGVLQAYCFGRPGYSYPQIGPVVARDLPSARELVAHCL